MRPLIIINTVGRGLLLSGLCLPALLVVLVLALLPTLQAAAQSSHVLIVEDLEKRKPNRYYYQGDLIMIHLAKSRELYKGRIRTFTDSSIQIRNKAYLLRNIDYVKVNDVGKLVAAGAPWTLGTGLFLLIRSYENVVTIPALVFIPIGTGVVAALFARNQPKNTKPLGHETGWRLRIKKIE